MHEQFLEGNYGSPKKLRSEANSQSNVVSQSSEVVDQDEDDSEDDEEEASDMVVEDDVSNKQVDAVEGWSVVPSRRNRGSRTRSQV
ncbi:hypothetical protein GIB67_036415 [Kingdonia uniflora]|uniref:Uncharacterized protein n=1 Tax=Kingdonia uniflora TaxID=39325 RepID=A0A7J7L499_9MAGN|nr:hypothetical protein GIB67_036415 [Kingdonia uniflora]